MAVRVLRTDFRILAGLLSLGLTSVLAADPSLGASNTGSRSYDVAGVRLAAGDDDDASPAGAKSPPVNSAPAKSLSTNSAPADYETPPPKAEAPESGDAGEAKAAPETGPSDRTELSVDELRKEWAETRKQVFAGKHQVIPDSEDPETVNHMNWYDATGYVRPYPGETKVRPPSDFPNRFKERREDADD